MRHSNLKREEGDAAGSRKEYRLAGLETALLYQREPRGQSGDRKRAGLYVVQRGRRESEPLFGESDVIGENAGVITSQ
jgi:hypothetical protein